MAALSRHSSTTIALSISRPRLSSASKSIAVRRTSIAVSIKGFSCVRRDASAPRPRTISTTSSSIGMELSSCTATPGMASIICCSSSVTGSPWASFWNTLGGMVTAPSWLAIAATG
jgi:hypothetical protein